MSEPIKIIPLGEAEITLLGTAHISQASADKVAELIETGDYQAVAVELCPSRYQAMMQPEQLAQMDLWAVIKQGKGYLVIVNLALSAYQRRLAEQLGIESGLEQKKAIALAQQKGLPLLLIDREISITLKRTAASLSWWKKWNLFTGLFLSVLTKEEISEEEIEKLKEGDILEATFAEFAQNRRELYQPLIAERDEYMAARLSEEVQQHAYAKVLAVVGAGHLAGIAARLKQGIEQPAQRIAELNQVPPPSIWGKLLPWLIVALILIGFIIGFQRSPELGWELVAYWILINGSLSAIGAAIAGAHPLSIITAFVAAPITSLNPTIGAGMVTAAVELWLRKPRVQDFAQLKQDTLHWSGWWRNRVSRILLVFLFSSFGSAIGTYMAGFHIFDRLS